MSDESEVLDLLRRVMADSDAFLNCTYDGSSLTAEDGTVVYSEGFLMEIDHAVWSEARSFLASRSEAPS